MLTFWPKLRRRKSAMCPGERERSSPTTSYAELAWGTGLADCGGLALRRAGRLNLARDGIDAKNMKRNHSICPK